MYEEIVNECIRWCTVCSHEGSKISLRINVYWRCKHICILLTLHKLFIIGSLILFTNYWYFTKLFHIHYIYRSAWPVSSGVFRGRDCAIAPPGLTVNFWIIFVSVMSRLNRTIRVPRLLVTIRAFCLLKSTLKCTHFWKKWFFSGHGA